MYKPFIHKYQTYIDDENFANIEKDGRNFMIYVAVSVVVSVVSVASILLVLILFIP